MKYIYSLMIGAICILLSGCGAVQSVSDATGSVAKAIFVWDVKTLHLDFTSRAELNLDDDAASSPVVIRIYQLKTADKFSAAPYLSLVDDDAETLGDTLLASKEFVLKPSSSISIDVPFDSKAEFVGIVALYKEPDLKKDNWRLLLKRRDLNISSARKIEVSQYHLTLLDD